MSAREHICKKASSANQAAMWKGKVRNLVPGDDSGENTQAEQNRVVATGVGMGSRRSWLRKIEVCSGKQ